MSKITLPLSIIAIIFSVFSFFYFQTSSDLVYVDVNKLIEGYKRSKVVRAEFEEKRKTMTSNVDSLMSNWKQELTLYEKERALMTEKEIELKQELLSNKQQQINNYQHAIQKQVQEDNKIAMQTVINDINDYIKVYGKEHGYDIIFGASGSGNIMYAKDTSDLTNAVLLGLNNEYYRN